MKRCRLCTDNKTSHFTGGCKKPTCTSYETIEKNRGKYCHEHRKKNQTCCIPQIHCQRQHARLGQAGLVWCRSYIPINLKTGVFERQDRGTLQSLLIRRWRVLLSSWGDSTSLQLMARVTGPLSYKKYGGERDLIGIVLDPKARNVSKFEWDIFWKGSW